MPGLELLGHWGEWTCFFSQPEGDFHGESMENPHENEHVLLGRVWIIELTIERACMSVKILDASCDDAVLQELRTWPSASDVKSPAVSGCVPGLVLFSSMLNYVVV